MSSKQSKRKTTAKEIAIFGMLGAAMYASKVIMEAIPNVHLISLFVIAITIVYRKKALYPIYIFVFLAGLLNGFGIWWVPYLYIWTVPWAVTMLLPKNMNPKIAVIVYMVVCAAHGFLFGVLYAPFQALAFGLSLKGTLAWIASGLPFDAIHGVSNLFLGTLIVPLAKLLRKLSH